MVSDWSDHSRIQLFSTSPEPEFFNSCDSAGLPYSSQPAVGEYLVVLHIFMSLHTTLPLLSPPHHPPPALLSWYHKQLIEFLGWDWPGRWESHYILIHSKPSSVGCGKYDWYCYTTLLPHQRVLVSADNLIYLLFYSLYNNYIHTRSAIIVQFWPAEELASLPLHRGQVGWPVTWSTMDADVDILSILKQNIVRKILVEADCLGLPPMHRVVLKAVSVTSLQLRASPSQGFWTARRVHTPWALLLCFASSLSQQEAVLKATAVRSPELRMFYLKTKKKQKRRNLSVPAGM